MSIQDFEGESLDNLQKFKTALVDALIGGLVRGQSYTIAGRSLSFASLDDLKGSIAAVNYAIGMQTQTRSSTVRANFNPGFNRRSS